jgi:hypothetical protein
VRRPTRYSQTPRTAAARAPGTSPATSCCRGACAARSGTPYVTRHFQYTFADDGVWRNARYYSPGWSTWAAVAVVHPGAVEEELRLYAAQTQPGRRILVLAWSREVELLFVRPCSHRQITRQRKRMAGPAPARSADRNGCSAGWTRHGEEGHRFNCLEWESSAVMAPTGYSRQLLLG